MPPPRQNKDLTSVSRIFAFTLAEVLITLGIIGVVAALTMPALITKYDEMVMVNKLKRTYSELANAIELRKAELGTDSYADQFNPDLSAAEQLDGFLKYLNVVERCSASDSQGCGGNYTTYPKSKTNDGYGNVKKGKFNGERAVLNDGTTIKLGTRNWTGNCVVTYDKYETNANGNYTNIVDGKPVPSGSFKDTQCAEIFFDINGPKRRNQYGYDMYSFIVRPTKLDQHKGYGGLYDTIRTGKLNYERYSEGKF